jgi:hypothetical protein
MTLDDILRQIFGNGGGAPAIGGDPVQASMAGEPPMYDPVARRYASEAPQMASPAPRLPAGGQTMAPGSMPPVQPGGASPPPAARPAANADPLSGLMPERPATDWRHTLGDVGLALQGRAVPDRAAMAREAEQGRLRANLTYQWMLKEGMSPEEARAALVSPEAQKVLFARRFGSGEKPTDEMREYDMARKQGFAGGFMDYKTKLKEAGASRVSIDQKQETEYDKKLGGLLAEDYVTAQRGASTAQRDLANLDTMKQALADPNLYTGSGGEAIQAAKKAAQTLLGMEVKGVSSAEVMQTSPKRSRLATSRSCPARCRMPIGNSSSIWHRTSPRPRRATGSSSNWAWPASGGRSPAPRRRANTPPATVAGWMPASTPISASSTPKPAASSRASWPASEAWARWRRVRRRPDCPTRWGCANDHHQGHSPTISAVQ